MKRRSRAGCVPAGYACRMAGIGDRRHRERRPRPPPPTAVSHNSSYIEPNGTAHVGRIVPVPQSLSPQAQASLRHAATDADVPESP